MSTILRTSVFLINHSMCRMRTYILNGFRREFGPVRHVITDDLNMLSFFGKIGLYVLEGNIFGHKLLLNHYRQFGKLIGINDSFENLHRINKTIRTRNLNMKRTIKFVHYTMPELRARHNTLNRAFKNNYKLFDEIVDISCLQDNEIQKMLSPIIRALGSGFLE